MKKSLFLSAIPITALLLLASCGGGQTESPMASEHTAMMKADSAADAAAAAQETMAREMGEIFATGNVDALETLLNDNFVDHQQDASITATGIEGARQMVSLVHTAFPDYKQEVVSVSTTGDRTFVHLRMMGTNTGPWGDSPATGKAMDVMAVDILRFENGKVSEHWGYMEEMKMMQQLGLMPDPAAAETAAQ